MRLCSNETRKKIDVRCWSDSQVTLQWLAKPSRGLKVFVAQRVANIQTISEELNIRWQWIAGEDNPADLISRGTTVKELHAEPKWWNGPAWLYSIEEDWPAQPEFINQPSTDEEVLKETRPIIHLVTSTGALTKGKWFKFPQDIQKEVPITKAYGNWRKLLGVTATVFKAAYKFQSLKRRKIGTITEDFEKLAFQFLIQTDQQASFKKEIAAAKANNREVLATLVLVWDNEEKFLRIDGRVRSANLSRDEQFPILLDKRGDLAPLLIRYAHLKGHGGTQWVLQYLRQKFWIIGARRLEKEIISKCPICRKLRLTTSHQLMASLPSYRTNPARAFKRVGVDYAGTVMLRSSLGRLPKLTKAWIAVFVCLTTRAIHLELVSDATTSAFIAALKRMISRRGMISFIISDNATNFVGANNFITAIQRRLNDDATLLEREFDLKWNFTTPAAPHHGGIYEAAVKSAKHHLLRIIGNTPLTFEEYNTILCQVEAMLNSRPLTPLNDDPTSLNALTPGHFLIGEALTRLPDEEDFRQIPENRLTRWTHLQKMAQQFWQRWTDEYLSGVINRSKWLLESRNFKIGDMVFLKDDTLPPLKWQLGRIQEVFPGANGLVRTVIVKTANGIYKRPIVKLGLLLANE